MIIEYPANVDFDETKAAFRCYDSTCIDKDVNNNLATATKVSGKEQVEIDLLFADTDAVRMKGDKRGRVRFSLSGWKIP